MRKKGFMLIGIIIIVMVIGILSTLSLARYNDFTENNKLDNDASKLVDILELARKKTVSGDNPTTCASFNGYGIANVDATSYKLQLCCSSDCSSYSDLNIYKLETTNSFTGNRPEIKFAPLTGYLHLPEESPGETLILTIKNRVINKCISINITYIGLITQQSKANC